MERIVYRWNGKLKLSIFVCSCLLLFLQSGCFSMRATVGMGMNVPTVSLGSGGPSTALPPPRRSSGKSPTSQGETSSHESGYAFDIHLGAYIPWGFRGVLLPELGYSLDAPYFPGKLSMGVGFMWTFPNTVTFALNPSATAIAYTPALLFAVDNESLMYGGLRNAIRFQFRRYWYVELQHELLLGAPGLTQNLRLMLGFDFGLLWSVQLWTRALRGLFQRRTKAQPETKK
ncbi:MAG: hypothetical protein EP343_16890 [Deltaproteobacteria bacterium]|nr:MAG: hypothetical protein EP343_16890 [Deltaproteobacteria bacterium]